MEKVFLEKGNSKLALDIMQGAQILELKLEVKNSSLDVILAFDSKNDFFRSGNFLMFPWVNRLENDELRLNDRLPILLNPKKRDSNGLPIHGNFFDAKRKLIAIRQNSITLSAEKFAEDFPEFTETFYLEKNSLSIEIEFFNPSNTDMFFSFGYHPYLKLAKKIDELKFETNLDYYIPLNEKLLPEKNFNPRPSVEIFGNQNSLKNIKLDHLLLNQSESEKTFFSLLDESENLELKLSYSKNSSYSFMQIYTSEDRNSIAIEPLSSTGNSFFNTKANLCCLRPNEKMKSSFKIELIDTSKK